MDGAFFVTSGYIEEPIVAGWDWAWGHPDPKFASVEAYKKSVIEREPKGTLHSLAIAGGFRLMHGCGAHFNNGPTVKSVNQAIEKAEGAKARFFETWQVEAGAAKVRRFSLSKMARDLRGVRRLQAKAAKAVRDNLLAGADTETLARMFPEYLSELMPDAFGHLAGAQPIKMRELVPESMRKTDPAFLERCKKAASPADKQKLVEELRQKAALERGDIAAVSKEMRGMLEKDALPEIWEPLMERPAVLPPNTRLVDEDRSQDVYELEDVLKPAVPREAGLPDLPEGDF
jgi:hypothetical protein